MGHPDRQCSTSGMQECIEDGDDINQDRYDAELDIVDHYAALKSTLNIPPRTDSLPKHNTPYGQSSSPNAYQSRSSIYTNNTYRNNDRVVGQSQAVRPPSKVSERSEPQDEYVNPRVNWNRQSCQEPATSYQDIFSPPPPTTARTVPHIARSGESIWDDAPLSGVSSSGLGSSGPPNVVRGIFETLSPGGKQQSKRASEWTPMPDLDTHTRELNENAYRTSRQTPVDYYTNIERPKSASIRHSQPDSIARKRGRAPSKLDSDVPEERGNPAKTAFQEIDFDSCLRYLELHWLMGRIWHSNTDRLYHQHLLSVQHFSCFFGEFDETNALERRSSKLTPDFGRFKDRPSTGTPVPSTASTSWSAFNRVFAPEARRRRTEKKGKGKEPESPRGRRSRR